MSRKNSIRDRLRDGPDSEERETEPDPGNVCFKLDRFCEQAKMKTLVLTDSAGAMSREEARNLQIEWLPLQILYDEKQYLDGVDLSTEQLYELLASGANPTTSQPPLVLIHSVLTAARANGCTDIIAVNLADRMSSTSRLIETAAEMLCMTVHTFDTCSAQAVEYYLAFAASRLVRQGLDPQEILAKLKNSAANASSYLIVDDINYLKNGGRLLPVGAKWGSLLRIRPVLEISRRTQGLVECVDKALSFSKALDKAIDRIANELKPDRTYEFFVDSSDSDQHLELAVEKLKNRFGPSISIHTLEMCSLVSCHVGLGSVALQYIEKVDGVELGEKTAIHPFQPLTPAQRRK